MNQPFDPFRPQSAESLFQPLDVLIVLGLTALLMVVVARSYQATHRGVSYTQSYIHSLFLIGLVTGIVMMIIGSNIARAFSLVGALSIIRFRTAVKDVRDTTYLFFAVVVGMGCGTGFYAHTAIFTLVTAGVMWFLHRVDFAAKDSTEEVLKVTFRRSSTETPAAIDRFLSEHFQEHRMINSIRHFDGDEDTLVYVVRAEVGQEVSDLARGLEEVEGVTRASAYIHDQQVNL